MTAATNSAVRWGQLTAGIIVVAVGLLVLLDRFDFRLLRDLGSLWPLVVIVVGIAGLLGADGS